MNLADIELPTTEFVENPQCIRELTNEVVEAMVEDSTAAIAPSQEEVQTHVSVEITNSANMAKTEDQLVFQGKKQTNLP